MLCSQFIIFTRNNDKLYIYISISFSCCLLSALEFVVTINSIKIDLQLSRLTIIENKCINYRCVFS